MTVSVLSDKLVVKCVAAGEISRENALSYGDPLRCLNCGPVGLSTTRNPEVLECSTSVFIDVCRIDVTSSILWN